jgi:hypothetical protein
MNNIIKNDPNDLPHPTGAANFNALMPTRANTTPQTNRWKKNWRFEKLFVKNLITTQNTCQ